MKAKIEKTSINNSKYDNIYYDIEIDGVRFERMEKSEVRHLIEILDNGIHH